MLELPVAIVANAFGRRFAGGLLGQWLRPYGVRFGTQTARVVQAGIVGATVAGVAPVAWWGAPVAVAAWIGATGGFGAAGMVPKTLRDVIELSVVHGGLATLPLAAAFFLCAWPQGYIAAAFLLCAGLLRGPAYWLATVWQPHVPALGLNPDGLPDPPALAEFYSGALLGAALVAACWSV